MSDYPTKQQIRKLRKHKMDRDILGFIELIREAWNHHYGRMWETPRRLHFATGGWSGNEEIISEIKVSMFWLIAWMESHRGGYYKFDMVRIKKLVGNLK